MEEVKSVNPPLPGTDEFKSGKPTQAQINEVIDPKLSPDVFKIGDKEIPIRVLPISQEKKIALAIDPILKKLEQVSEKSIGTVLSDGGGKAIAECQDVLVDIALIICQKHDSKIDRTYIEENASTAELWALAVAQIKKNRLGDMVSSFFLKVATLMPHVQPSL